MPDVLMGICLLSLFIALSVKLSLLTVFLAHTTFSLSYVALIVRSRLDMLDPSIIEAARDLGASSFQVFRKILFPFMLPAIIAGALLAFTLSLDDFVITFFVVGPGATTLPVYVYSMMKFFHLHLQKYYIYKYPFYKLILKMVYPLLPTPPPYFSF